MDGQSKGAGFLITGADMTERTRLEEQLRQAQKLEAIWTIGRRDCA